MSRTPVLTTKDLRKSGYRWMLGISTFNYESQLAPSVIYSLAPALRKIYKDENEYIEALNNHYKYFNTMPWIANILLGAVLAMEDNQGIEAKDAVQDFKVGLMGPLAGVGDTIFWTLIPTIFGSIAGYMALKGNPIGLILWLSLNVFFFIVRTRLFEFGYKQGVRIITELGKQLNVFTEAASVLGLTVVGALIPTVINLKTVLQFKTGDVAMEIQPLLDQVLPALLPVALTAIIYYFMGKKKVKMTTIILLIIVLSMLGSALGIV